MMIISLFLVLLVTGSCAAVMYLFFKRLRRIEAELWGQKAREAEHTANTGQNQPTEKEANQA